MDCDRLRRHDSTYLSLFQKEDCYIPYQYVYARLHSDGREDYFIIWIQIS